MTFQNRIVGHGELPASQFIANPNNPRRHPEAQRKAVKASLDTLGWVAPVIVNRRTGYLVDGHERIWQALKQGDDTLVPYIEIDISEDEERQFLATFDYITYLATYDNEILSGLMQQIDTGNADIQALLSEMAESQGVVIDDVYTPVGDVPPQEDKAAELQAAWNTARGQIWHIISKDGKRTHRVMCGDSTDAVDVAALMDGHVTEFAFTSPPYADMRDYRNADVSVTSIASFLTAWATCARYIMVNLGIKRHDSAVVPYWDEYIERAQAAGLRLLSWGVWDKGASSSIASETAILAIEHEFLFLFGANAKGTNRIIPIAESTINRRKYYRKDSQGRMVTTNRQRDGTLKYTTTGELGDFKSLGTVIRVPQDQTRTELLTAHPARFPVGLPTPNIRAFTNEGDIVADPFLGSGTTLVACEQTGRIGYGMEIAPEYVAVVLQRMADMGCECVLTNPAP